MLIFCLLGLGTGSALLIGDYYNRKRFGEFMKNGKTEDGRLLIEGVLKSNEPLMNPLSGKNEVAIMKQKIQVKSYHTSPDEPYVVEVFDNKIVIPTSKITTSWVSNSRSKVDISLYSFFFIFFSIFS